MIKLYIKIIFFLAVGYWLKIKVAGTEDSFIDFDIKDLIFLIFVGGALYIYYGIRLNSGKSEDETNGSGDE